MHVSLSSNKVVGLSLIEGIYAMHAILSSNNVVELSLIEGSPHDSWIC